ncbi:PEP-CTERM sorting domain-containing protein [Nitrosospira sp. Nsp13]|jgi:MYXO-CTERM domain-containing protein|uniref:PEP-CTERM sorting domain-containing protein n=1 Tax=Nitrosospira sp. Nsp13 TaxID=1855332 RepID=UPI00088FA244|nr:PEP-CTERM sorting domain-containing protein [Nitrosospira sp. Nsp13]SCY11980.1 PEP-CTERM protein-sorting domain-containing protein/MYXO-CTERM domain-containing protein [Nitrosospira sp. Nsp13]
MKMNFKLKALAVAAIMAASAPAFAAIDGGVTGNGELLLNVRYYGGDSATTGGDDISALFDLGLKMNDVLAANSSLTGLAGTWNLNSGAYGASWNQLVNFVGAANIGKIEFNVIALDDTDRNLAGGSRYLMTGNVNSWPSQGNTNVKTMNIMEAYIDANNSRGTHATDANGASVAMPTDAPNTFFGAIGGSTQGDNWMAKTTVDTTQVLGTEQNFWFLTTSSTSNLAQATKTPFGVDLNHDGVIGAGEFTKIALNEAGILSITSPVPEADTWAMLLAGLGMLGAMVRRRTGV